MKRYAAMLLALCIVFTSHAAFAGLGASVTIATGQPTLIYPSEVTQLQITLSNNNATAPITNLDFDTLLPGTLANGLRVAGLPTYTCTDPTLGATTPGLGTLNAGVGTQDVELDDGVIPARDATGGVDGTCTIIVPVTAFTTTGGAAAYTYTIGNGIVTGDDGAAQANAGSVSQGINVRALNQPTITKSFSNNTAILGGASRTLTITIGNNNPVALPNFSVTDNFPQLGGLGIIKVANPVVSTSTCSGAGTPATFTAVADASSVTATAGTVAANGTCTMTVAVVANQTNGLYDTGLQTNTINGTTNFSNDIGITATNGTAQIRARSPLNISKAFTTASVASGSTATFNVTLSNTGTTPLDITGFTDDPVDGLGNAGYGLKVNAITGVTCTPGGTPGTFSIITGPSGNTGIQQDTDTTIAGNGSCTITVDVDASVQTPNTPISYTNSIPANTVTTSTPGVVSQAASSSILVFDDLRVLKSVIPATAGAGEPVQYTVTVQNYLATPLNDLSVRETLTNGQTFLTGTIGTTNYTPSLSGNCSGLAVTGALGATNPRFDLILNARTSAFVPASCNIVFWVKASRTQNYTNTLVPGSVCYNADSVCNGAPPPTIPSGNITTAILGAAKAYSPAGPLSEGAITRLTVTLTNLSANPLTSVTVNDPLPLAASGGQMRLATPPNAATTCGAGVITAVGGATSFTMNGGTVPARAGGGTGANGTCVVQVDVTGAAGVYAGASINTATAAGTQLNADGLTTDPAGPVNATAAFTFSSALGATKSFSPASVSSGGQSTVRIRLNNAGAVALTNVGVTDPLPTGMVLANPVTAYSTCAGAPVFTSATPGANTISMTGAALAGGGNCDVLFNVIATGGAPWVNTIPIGNITADGGVSNQSAVTGTLLFDAPTNLVVAKSTNPSTLTFPGQISQLTIDITNGNLAVTGLDLVDYFTADGTSVAAGNGMAIAPTPAASTTCPGGTVTATPGSTSVAVNGASLGANSNCTVTVNVTSTSVGGITNFIPPGSIQTDQGLTNSGQATTSLTTQSNIGVTKQFTPNVVSPGQRSRLRITFYNPTAQPASAVTVTDNLPAGVTVPGGANPTSTCSGASVTSPTPGQVQVTGGNIVAAVGGVAASCYAEIDVTVAAEGDYVNTIPAGGVTATVGGAPATNSQPTSDTLRAKDFAEIHKAFSNFTLDAGNPVGFTTGSATAAPGASAVMTIRLSNPNGAPLTAAALTDTLPTGLVVATTPAAATTCGGTVTAAASATTVRLTGGTIPAGGSCNVTVNVLSNISGTYVNTIPASALTTFEGVTNEEPTSAEIMVSTPPTVTKEFDSAVIPSGGTSRMTIFLGNDNDIALTLTSVFTDNLPTAPGPVLVAATPNVVKTCPGAVTATAGSATVSYANGASIPIGGCSITVSVTASVPGVHTNNIPAGRLQTNFGNSQDPANATLTVSSLGFISGRVFQDADLTPNGVFNSGTDAPITGTTVELHSGATCGGALVDTQVTNAVGNYLFSSLAAGTYSVCEPVQPAGTSNGITTTGVIAPNNGSTGTAGVGSNPTATTSQIVNIILNGDGGGGEISGSTGNNFAEIVLSSISGTVFRDVNNNGVQNGADTGISGLTIELLDNLGAVINSTTTNGTGGYTFPNLAPGTYSVREPTQPPATSNGITTPGAVPNGGTAGTATNPATVPSVISNIILPPNTASTANNFAEIPNGRNISGNVFLDYDNNGAVNGPDHGIGTQTVNLTGTDINGNPVTASTTTNVMGAYSFTGLPAGTYTVSQPGQPAGTTNGTTTQGSTGGTASNPTATTSEILNLDLTGANNVSVENNFAEIPGAAPDLTITKTHTPSGFGEGSDTGYFTITPSNIGASDTSGVITIVDTLPAGMTVAAPATGTGWVCVGAVGASSVTCTTNDVIAAGSNGNDIILRVQIAPGLAGQLLVNNAVISGGGEPPGFDGNNSDDDTVAITATANVSGTIWRDFDHDRTIGGGEPRVPGWDVELLLNAVLIRTVQTAADGTYAFTALSPGDGYQIRFREPTTDQIYGRAVPNEQGITPANDVRDTGDTTVNPGVNNGNPAGADVSSGDGTLRDITLLAGDNIIEQSLPLDPAGVVYDSVTRLPVAGADVTITGPGGFNPAIHVVGGNATVTTAADGFYQFLLTAGAPAGDYTLTITTYPGGYLPLPSALIPVCTNAVVVSPPPPDPALVQTTPLAPGAATPAHNPAACPASSAAFTPGDQATTQHYFTFTINPATSANIVNNHIPLDPVLGGAIVLTKTSPMVNVSIGQLVPYVITLRNTLGAALSNIDIIDTLPPGFKFKAGSATLDNASITPTLVGRTLTFPNLTIGAGATRTIKLLMVVGAGVQPGEYVNRAQAFNNLVVPPTPNAVSNIATATVRVIPDPVFDCSDLIGKVFDDKNTNGYQDQGEPGIPAVRVATVNGLLVTTDAEGRFHIACAAIPDADRGSNFIMKLDERTLPTGYRVTTENPRIIRMTRGKMMKLNFGAAIHKVIRVDMRDAAFEPGTTNLRPEWQQQIAALPEKLRDRPGVLRISYVATGEGDKLARDRLKAVSKALREAWKKKDCCHELQIEEELVLPGKGK